ncbi:hypothetical protein DK389_03630 [Methylobacterium durans]|uniref:Uncharacterized protein n=1 Tax=Methylobacterium durans TaxID=2202825 RepID=A0A2U8W352_9HYPH|nr:hypothetical protein DK389_03630 [Methylobacterium durans]
MVSRVPSPVRERDRVRGAISPDNAHPSPGALTRTRPLPNGRGGSRVPSPFRERDRVRGATSPDRSHPSPGRLTPTRPLPNGRGETPYRSVSLSSMRRLRA